jgi:S1-C subfamily serine protease
MENTWKWSIALLTMLLSMLAHVSFPCPVSAQDEFRELKRGVVKIIAHKPQNVIDTGAGIIVGTDDNITLIVTAHHVIQDTQQIEVVFFDKQYAEFQGRPFRRYHEDLDIAVVTVESVEGRKIPPNLPHFTLGDIAKLKEGARVSTIGHPLDRDWQASIKTNTIAGLSDQEDFRKLRFTKTAMERGNSGGPLFNDAGALIGMVTKLDPVHAVAVKIDALLAVLRDEWRMPIWWRAEEGKTALA